MAQRSAGEGVGRGSAEDREKGWVGGLEGTKREQGRPPGQDLGGGDVVAQSEGTSGPCASCSGIWFFPELQEWKWVFMGAEGRLAVGAAELGMT